MSHCLSTIASKEIQKLNHMGQVQISPSKWTPPYGLSWQQLQHYHNQFSGIKEVIRDVIQNAKTCGTTDHRQGNRDENLQGSRM